MAISDTYDLRNLDILCVDDSRTMHKIMKSFLSTMQVDLTRFSTDANEAYAMIQERVPSIVITELEMQPLDGFEFIRRIRRGEDSSDIYVPILVLTGHTELHHIIGARDAGATEILAKPVSVESLYHRLIWMVDNPRPFIVAKGFVGPDRRRAMRGYEGLERRTPESGSDAEPVDSDEPEGDPA
jgi:DNA-binding response OmpR family regulator